MNATIPSNYPKSHLWGYLSPMDDFNRPISLWKLSPLTSIGKAEGNDVVIPSEELSPEQCTLEWDGKEENNPVTVEDLSEQGTFINDQLVGFRKKAYLKSGDTIQFGCRSVGDRKKFAFIFQNMANDPKATEIRSIYLFGKSLGRGGFGSVVRALHINTGVRVAIKSVARNQMENDGRKAKMFFREVSILQSLRHEYICGYRDCSIDHDFFYLVMEYVPGGDLSAITDKKTTLPEVECRRIIYEVSSAVAYLHSRSIIHRDIKPANILLTKDRRVKLADFGVSKAITDITKARSIVGTLHFLAPEVILREDINHGYDHVIDSWAIGIVAFKLLCGEEPFLEDELERDLRFRFRTKILAWHHLNGVAGKITYLAYDLVKGYLEFDPSGRLSPKQALDHPWLSNASHVISYEAVSTSVDGAQLDYHFPGAYLSDTLHFLDTSQHLRRLRDQELVENEGDTTGQLVRENSGFIEANEEEKTGNTTGQVVRENSGFIEATNEENTGNIRESTVGANTSNTPRSETSYHTITTDTNPPKKEADTLPSSILTSETKANVKKRSSSKQTATRTRRNLQGTEQIRRSPRKTHLRTRIKNSIDNTNIPLRRSPRLNGKR